MVALNIENRRVAILEDNPTNRERWTDLVSTCGAVPVPISPRAPNLENLPGFLKEQDVSLLLCDNRLFEGNYANYWGAEAIAKSYQAGYGGVLVTAYELDDVEVSIRLYRRWIPSLVHATKLRRSILTDSLTLAHNEVHGEPLTAERTPHRSLMTIRRVDIRNNQAVVKVLMSQWDSKTEIGFPLKMIPENLHAAIRPNNLLIAEVNIDAARAEDLFFENFELPNPDTLRNAESLFNDR